MVVETLGFLCLLEVLYRFLGRITKKWRDEEYESAPVEQWVDVEGGAKSAAVTPCAEVCHSSSSIVAPRSSAWTAEQNEIMRSTPCTIRTRRRVRFCEPLAYIIGFADTHTDYDRESVKPEHPEQTEDVLTWISSSLQNNTNDVSVEEKDFFLSKILTLYDTDFGQYQASLVECVCQFVLREHAIQEFTLLKIRLLRESLRNNREKGDQLMNTPIERYLSEHCNLVAQLTPWDTYSHAVHKLNCAVELNQRACQLASAG